MVKVDFQADKVVIIPDEPVTQVIIYTGCDVKKVNEDKLHRLHVTVEE